MKNFLLGQILQNKKTLKKFKKDRADVTGNSNKNKKGAKQGIDEIYRIRK